MEKLIKRFGGFKNLKKDQLFIILLVGILLFVISLPTGDKESSLWKDESKNDSESEEKITVSESAYNLEDNRSYVEELENKLKSVLMQVAGVGNVRVMITLESSAETVVEKDIPNTRNTSSESDSAGGTRTSMDLTSTEETVYVTNESGTQVPYVVKEMEPQIKGVVIVAQGGDNPLVITSITEAAQALFQIEAHKIKVMKMKNQK